MSEKDKAGFVKAAIKEMNSLHGRKTFTRLTRKQCHDKYWRNGMKTKNLPSKVVLTKKPDFETEEDWKPKVRVTACGNFELEDIMTRFENRSEVPDAFMVRTVVAFVSQTDWSIGAADLSTAFLNAELDDAEDGVYLILPPKFIINLGLEEEGILWKLDYALYGLKRALRNGREQEITG